MSLPVNVTTAALKERKIATETIFVPAQPETPSGKKPQAVTHLVFLDGLRALAALYVVLHHSVAQFKNPSGSLYRLYETIFSKGHFAVDVFIVLSGFCLMLPEVRTNRLRVSPAAFIKKRLKRILPTYYLAMAFSLVLIYTIIGTPSGTHWDQSIPVSKWDLFTHLTLIQDIFNITNARINHSFWSIAVEFRIYFLFPLMVALFRKANPFTITAGTVAVSVCSWGILKHFTVLNSSPWGINPHYLGLFTIGMLSAWVAYSKNGVLTRVKESRLFLLLPVALIVLACRIDAYKFGLWIAADLAIGLSCACLLIGLTSGKFRTVYRLLSWRPLATTGLFAYSIYLIHAPLLEVFSRYVVEPLDLSTDLAVVAFVSIATPMILVISYLFYLAAEKPFIRKKAAQQDTVSA